MNLQKIGFIVFSVLFCCFLTLPRIGISQQAQKQASQVKVGQYGTLHKNVQTREKQVIPSLEYRKKKEIAERLDTAKLLYNGRVVVDKDPKMLVPPKNMADFSGKEYIIAKEPPTVDFAVIPVDNLWLDQPTVISKSKTPNQTGPWANWANATYDRRTGKFYSAIGDHGMYGARIHLVEYDPAAKKVKTFAELNRGVFGRTKDQFGDGKIHGWLTLYQSKQLDRPHIWFSTFWTKYPYPDEDDFQTGFEGAHIMSCDPLTGDVVDYGVPMPRQTWPYHRVDTKRGIFYAVASYEVRAIHGPFLAWDINAQKVKWAGYPPKGMDWFDRVIMIDEETGMVYSSNFDNKSDPEIHMIKYDPYKNLFFKLNCTLPRENLGNSDNTSQIRANTWDRGPDGLFWGVTYGGKLFTFDPVKEEIIEKNTVWPGRERYTTTMDRSPGGRYLYYLPGAHGTAWTEGTPLIQYDTRTNTRKVLAFMYPYYFEKYGYTPGGTFSIKLDNRGEKLFICWNGAFIEHKSGEKVEDTFGACSVMTVTIPERERRE